MIEQTNPLAPSDTISVTERIITGFSDLAWGTPLLVLLLGGGLFFLFYSRLLPLRYPNTRRINFPHHL